jgi:hypothetical protein
MKNTFQISFFALAALGLLSQSVMAGSRLFPTLSHQEAPKAKTVLYFGGPVISNVKIIAVFWGPKVDADTQARIGDYYTAATNSSYMDWLTEYNTEIKAMDGRQGTNQTIGRGTYAGAITISPKNLGTKLDKADVEAELQYQMDQKVLPAPDANSLYMIHFPAGITLLTGGEASCDTWCGDHEGVQTVKYGNIYYAMMPDLGGNCQFGCDFAGSAFDSLTVIASHEMIEAVTDPLCPNINDNPAYPAAWMAQDQNEIGDLCTGGTASLTANKTTYTVQTEWDESISGCKGGTFRTGP